MTSIELINVEKRFGEGSESVLALEETSLVVDSGEIVSIVGPSGCGKTTLLNLVAGFTTPTRGRVLLEDQVAGPPDGTRAVVFQDDAVFPWLTVEQNLSYGPRVRGVDRATWKPRVEHFLGLVGLPDFQAVYPKALSGGMRKRVDLARAYVNDPDVLLMDEPFGALDIFTKEAMWQSFEHVATQEAKTVLFVTHDIEEAIFVGDRVLVMTPRPARVAQDIRIDFARPRELSLRANPAFQQLRLRIAEYLAQEDGL